MANIDSSAVPTGYPFDRESAAKRVTLMRERIGIHAKAATTAEFLRHAKIDLDMYDELARQVAVQLDGFLTTAVHQPVKAKYQTPATAWQHIKHQYFPTWLKSRFPVKYETKEFTLRGNMFVCPHLGHLWERNREQQHVEFVSLTDFRPSLMEQIRK